MALKETESKSTRKGLTTAQVSIAGAIIAEASLSFLGLGFPPDIPTWGRLLYDAKDYLDIAPHWALFAGGAIFLTVIAINFIGDGLRDVLDPRPETETVVEAALELFEDRRSESLRVLDLGVGSGAILCALLSEFQMAQGLGVDRSEEVLQHCCSTSDHGSRKNSLLPSTVNSLASS